MESTLSEHLQCAICLCDFTNPVSLPCEHSFCWSCILTHMQACTRGSFCPECRQRFTQADVRPNVRLSNVVLAVQKERSSTAAQIQHDGVLLCTEHDERLKLFCETDETLVCVICRDGHRHQGHQFKPVNEVVEIMKDKVKASLEILTSECKELIDLITEQTAEIHKTKMKSNLLSAQISAQFEEMYQLLRKKEEEVKKRLEIEERRTLEPMEETKNVIEMLLSRRQKEYEIFTEALSIYQPEVFIQWWKDSHTFTENIQKEVTQSLDEDDLFILKDTDFMTIPDSLSLGPYETHLQFFVWKEMLRFIKPVAECLTISKQSCLIVSPDGFSVRQPDISHEDVYRTEVAYAEETFVTGQHYWEVEVGESPDWCLGVEKRNEGRNFLERLLKREHHISKFQLQLMNDKDYVLRSNNIEIPVLTHIKAKLRKIGIYLDCERNEVLFYNADDMSLIRKFVCSFRWPWSFGLYPGMNSFPLTVCCYQAGGDAYSE